MAATRRKPDPPRTVPPDLIRTASDRQAVAEGCYFDQAAVDRVIFFLETFCCHTKDRWYGKPFRLLAWQRDYIRQVYGWKRADGTRRFRVVYCEIPKKNGKTELVSALALYHLMADGVNAAEVYLCATTRKQAGLAFKDAVMMVESSPSLRRKLWVKDSFHEKTIEYHANRSRLEVMSSDAPSADGKSASYTLFDELHRQPNADLWNVMEQAGIARDQPILSVITTAGDDLLGICRKQHDYGRQVERGEVVDTEFLPIIYSADPEAGDDVRDPALWERVNPSWGVTIKPQDFANAFARAEADPVQFNNFLRLRLNVWVRPDTAFVDRLKWLSCADQFADVGLAGRTCYGGLDLSSVSDITAFVLVFPQPDGQLRLWFRFWIAEEYAALRQRKDSIPYLDWAKQGLITLIPGGVIDLNFIKPEILAAAERFKLKKLMADPFNAQQLCLELAAEGLKVEYLRQGPVSMNGPCKEILRLVLDGKLRHPGNAAMDWMMGNARATMDSQQNIKINKEKSKDKVDGPVALANAVGAYLSEKPKRKSVYSRYSADELLGTEGQA